MVLFGGEVSLQTQGGKLVKMTLSSHEISANVHDYSNDELSQVVDKNIALGRFRNAWAICEVRKSEVKKTVDGATCQLGPFHSRSCATMLLGSGWVKLP